MQRCPAAAISFGGFGWFPWKASKYLVTRVWPQNTPEGLKGLGFLAHQDMFPLFNRGSLKRLPTDPKKCILRANPSKVRYACCFNESNQTGGPVATRHPSWHSSAIHPKWRPNDFGGCLYRPHRISHHHTIHKHSMGQVYLPKFHRNCHCLFM